MVAQTIPNLKPDFGPALRADIHRTAPETVSGLDQKVKMVAPIWAIPEVSGIHSLFHDFRTDAPDNPPLEDGILDGHLCIPSFSPPGV